MGRNKRFAHSRERQGLVLLMFVLTLVALVLPTANSVSGVEEPALLSIEQRQLDTPSAYLAVPSAAPPAIRLDWTDCIRISSNWSCSTYWTPMGTPVTCKHPSGTRTPVVYSNGVFSFYRYKGGDPPFVVESTVTFGLPGDVPLCGDWDGNGTDTVGVLRGRQLLLRNANSAGNPDLTLTLQRDYTWVHVGDWDGDGKDGFLGRRYTADGSTFDVINSYSGQILVVSHSFHMGDWADRVFTVDDNPYNRDSIASVRSAIGCHPSCTIYLYYSPRIDQTVPEFAFRQNSLEFGHWYFQGSFTSSWPRAYGDQPSYIAVHQRGLA